MQKLNSKLLQKVSKTKTTLKDSIIFTCASLIGFYILLIAMCYAFALIDSLI